MTTRGLDLLVAAAAREDQRQRQGAERNPQSWAWATVVDIDPLTIRRDGDTTATSPAETLVPASALSPGQRVWVQHDGRRRLILGTAHGAGGDTGWVDLTMKPGFTSGSARARLKAGTVRLRGTVTRDAGLFTTTTETIGTLPDGFAPAGYSRFVTPLYASSSAGSLIVTIVGGSLDIQCASVGTSSDILYLTPVWFDVD